ncbi:VOC family protein [Streptomyces monashensis]|uniref:VOC family protein n=1 Tax=Streptomyces monashensis TaxID=1678012 RepID=UPI0033DDFEA4
MATKEIYDRFVPLLYVENSLEAIAFYTDAFALTELTERTMLLSQVPGMEQVPGAERTVVYSKLQFTDGSALGVAELASDSKADGEHVIGNNIHIGLVYEDLAEQRVAFDKLAREGKVLEELEDRFWGAAYGAVRDKYGVIWETNCYLTPSEDHASGTPA